MAVTVGNKLPLDVLKSQGFTVAQKDGQYTVTKDGITVVVSGSDTIWDVYDKFEEAKYKQYVESKRPENNEEFQEHREKQLSFAEKFDYWMDAMKRLRGEFNSFLAQNNAKSLSDLTEDKKVEGMKIYYAKSDAVTNKNAALAGVIREGHAATNALYDTSSTINYLG